MVDIYLASITHLVIGLSTHSPVQSVWSWKSFLRSDPSLVWSSQGSRQFHPHYNAEEKDLWFFLGSCSPTEISWTLIGLCVPLSPRYYAHISLTGLCVPLSTRYYAHISFIGLCVPLSPRYYAHICLPILWAHTPRQRYELGHFPCGSRSCYGALCSGLSRNQSSGL